MISGDMTILERFLDDRLLESEAEFRAEGDTFWGHRGLLGCATLRLRIEICKAIGWPPLRRALLARIARRHFARHPDYRTDWRP